MCPDRFIQRLAACLAAALAFSLAIVATPVAASSHPVISRFELIDAETGAFILSVPANGTAVVERRFLPEKLTVIAVAERTESVWWETADGHTNTENLEPFTLAGDRDGTFGEAPLRMGVNRIEATPYPADRRAGAPGETATLRLEFYEADFMVDSATDANDAAAGDGICADADGRCTLRSAIEEANALPGHQTISLTSTRGIYELSLGQLDIVDSLGIRGLGMPIIDGRERSRVFNIEGTAVEFDGVHVDRGNAGSTGQGGGFQIGDSLVWLRDSMISSGRANIGGGIAAFPVAVVHIDRSVIRYNTAGRYRPETFSGGGLTQRGGGIAIHRDALVILTNSTVDDNQAARGGGISVLSGELQMSNSTVIDNRSMAVGGGLEVQGDGFATIGSSTIAFNEAGTSDNSPTSHRFGGGLFISGEVLLANSIVAANRVPEGIDPGIQTPDCAAQDGLLTSVGGNVIGVLTELCSVQDLGEGALLHGQVDAPLDPLFAGRTAVERAVITLDPASPAVDLGIDGGYLFSDCPAADQLGTMRPQGSSCDAGAYEVRWTEG